MKISAFYIAEIEIKKRMSQLRIQWRKRFYLQYLAGFWRFSSFFNWKVENFIIVQFKKGEFQKKIAAKAGLDSVCF